MKFIGKAVLGGLIFIVAVVVAIALIAGGAAHEADKSIKADHAKGAAHTMSPAVFQSVKPGVRYKDFLAKYGDPLPDETQTSTVQGLRSVTVYYNVTGGKFLDEYQFSFDNGKLVSKSKM